MNRIVHLTTVHNRNDNRVFLKECKTLAAKGYAVTLLVADGKGSERKAGVNIIDVGKPVNRLHRMIVKAFIVFLYSIKMKARIYHFHDPELIPWALGLKLAGKKVVYDIHEDYKTSILQKIYLNSVLRKMSAFLFEFIERKMTFFFYIIIAEKYYERKFENATKVLNYPIILDGFENHYSFSENSSNLLYTGNISINRGIANYIDLMGLMDNMTLTLIGRYDTKLIGRLMQSKNYNGGLNFVGSGEHVSYKKIVDCYKQKKWLAGLAIFPPTGHYLEKELTKFFEYMFWGIPIIASDFPVWKELIDKNGVGFCVDPKNLTEIRDKIRYLQENPGIAKKMSEKGKELAIKKYRWRNQAENLLNLYKSIL